MPAISATKASTTAGATRSAPEAAGTGAASQGQPSASPPQVGSAVQSRPGCETVTMTARWLNISASVHGANDSDCWFLFWQCAQDLKTTKGATERVCLCKDAGHSKQTTASVHWLSPCGTRCICTLACFCAHLPHIRARAGS